MMIDDVFKNTKSCIKKCVRLVNLPGNNMAMSWIKSTKSSFCGIVNCVCSSVTEIIYWSSWYQQITVRNFLKKGWRKVFFIFRWGDWLPVHLELFLFPVDRRDLKRHLKLIMDGCPMWCVCGYLHVWFLV